MSGRHFNDNGGQRGPVMSRRAAVGAIAGAVIVGAGAAVAAMASKRLAGTGDKSPAATIEPPDTSDPAKDATAEPAAPEAATAP